MFLKKLMVGEFTNSAPQLWQELQERFREVHGYRPGPSEINSWKQSLPALANILIQAADPIKDCVV